MIKTYNSTMKTCVRVKDSLNHEKTINILQYTQFLYYDYIIIMIIFY